MRQIDTEKSSKAFIIFDNNVDILERNLNRVLWSLKEIKDLLNCNPDLIGEFDEVFDDEEYDIKGKINEAISVTLNQYYVLLFSHLKEYKSKLEEKINFCELYKGKEAKTVFDYLLPERKTDIDDYYEIRNAIVHNKGRVREKYIIKPKDYIDSDKKIHLKLENYEALFDEIHNFSTSIDKKAIEEFPSLID